LYDMPYLKGVIGWGLGKGIVSKQRMLGHNLA